MAYQLVSKDKRPVKYNGQDLWASDKAGIIKSVNLNDRILTLRGTDESADRDGDIVASTGWDFKNFKKNPVFLWAHDYSSVPLAKIPKIIKGKDNNYDFMVQFPTLGLHPFADMILALYNEKIINACSVGFLPKEWEAMETKEDNIPQYMRPRKFTKQELLELSGCAVPSNPNAVQDMVKSMSFGGVQGVELFKVFNGQSALEIKNRDDILGELEVKCLVVEEETTSMISVPENIEDKHCKVVEEEEKENKTNEAGKSETVVVNVEDANLKVTVRNEGTIETIENKSNIATKPEETVNISIKDIQKFIDELQSVSLAKTISIGKLINSSGCLSFNDIAIDIKASLEEIKKDSVTPIQKQGAVLNKKNKENLKQAQELIQTVIDSSEKEKPSEDGSNQEQNPTDGRLNPNLFDEGSKSQAQVQADKPNESKGEDLYKVIFSQKADENHDKSKEAVKVREVKPTINVTKETQYNKESLAILIKNVSALVDAINQRGY